MTLQLSPETERLIDEHLKSGHFRDAEAVVQAALLELSQPNADVELDEEDIAAINLAEEEGERGDVIEFHQYRAEFQKRLAEELG